MLVNALIGLAIVIALLVALVATRPAGFRVARSTTIDAQPDVVFAQVNDFHHWDVWSPWAKLDPNSKATFNGPASGKGAHFHWSGNKQVGEGSMRIVDSQPTDRIGIQIEFVRPFKATNDVEFTFKPVGDQTHVTWAMSGKNNFMFKAFSLFMSCDKMLGGQFEIGLANMKSLVESSESPAQA